MWEKVITPKFVLYKSCCEISLTKLLWNLFCFQAFASARDGGSNSLAGDDSPWDISLGACSFSDSAVVDHGNGIKDSGITEGGNDNNKE